MTRVHCELSVEFLVQAVVGVVGDGRLLELRCGYCDVTATLDAEGRQLAARQVRLELPGVIRLGGGYPSSILCPSGRIRSGERAPQDNPPGRRCKRAPGSGRGPGRR